MSQIAECCSNGGPGECSVEAASANPNYATMLLFHAPSLRQRRRTPLAGSLSGPTRCAPAGPGLLSTSRSVMGAPKRNHVAGPWTWFRNATLAGYTEPVCTKPPILNRRPPSPPSPASISAPRPSSRMRPAPALHWKRSRASVAYWSRPPTPRTRAARRSPAPSCSGSSRTVGPATCSWSNR